MRIFRYDYIYHFHQFREQLFCYSHNCLNFIHFTKSCNMSTNILQPPKGVQGMQVLDKSKFTNDILVSVLKLKDVKVSDIMPHIKEYCLKLRHMKPIQNQNNERYVLLKPAIRNWFDMNAAIRDSLEKLFITENDFGSREITITYDNYHADEIFKAILPVGCEGFSSFSQVGHVIHLNLREHLLPFKNIIGQVLLEKIPRTRTVVNKIDTIDNTYRNFQMEKVCGEDDMLVTTKENNCQFQFDFSKVYWNPRLSTEHERIIGTMKSGDVLFDVFAGVGPFAIPAAKKGCIVYANDLNPESFKWLNYNKIKNKVITDNLLTFNKDGAQFIREDVKNYLLKHINRSNITIVMNLPAMAVEFLKNFENLYTNRELTDVLNPPILHVYCFAKGEDSMSITRQMIKKHFDFNVEDKIVNIFCVRTVSNFKEMMRVTIKLDRDLLVGPDTEKRKSEFDLESNCKKSVIMGKNKSKQMKKVIKVVGVKNTKMKNKAKPVNIHLKRINLQNKDKVAEMDKKLIEFRTQLQKGAAKTKTPISPDKEESVIESVDNFKQFQKASEQTLQELDKMELQDS